jgi:hypothetical protein
VLRSIPAPRILPAGLAALVLVALAAFGPAGLPGAPAPVAAASGLTTTADARYAVDTVKHAVHVTVALSATNHLKDTKTHRYYFDRAYLAVPPGTTGFRVSSPGTKPTVALAARHQTYNLLRIDFGKQLPAGASRAFSLAFDIPDPGGAPTRPTRIGTSLVTFSAWGLGSDGATGGSVTVVFPPGFNVDVHAAGLGAPTTDAAGYITYTTGRLANPLTFIASFAADRPSAFKETTFGVKIGTQTVPIIVRAWPDDPAWAKRVTSLLKRGLPALSSAIGLPWTATSPLIVQEAVSRNASGFAGRYDPPSGTIEIAYYADTFVILHEAAHAWFDGRLLADRWATEGFSSWYALQAARAIHEKKVIGDALTPALDKVRVPLNAWSAPTDGSTTPVDDAEYAAALRLAALVAKRTGPEGLQAVWRAIHDGAATYQPPAPAGSSGSGAPEVDATGAAPDWRGLLDLIAEHAGVDVSDLWAAWVVRPNEAPLLGQRTAARAQYASVVGRAASWQLPRIVRDAMRVWQYQQAAELLDSADRALDDREVVAAAASAAGLTSPDTMRSDFEGPRGFAAASAEADAEVAAIATYREAAAARPLAPNPFQAIGLWNASPDAALAQAATAFAAGDLRATVEASTFAEATWTSADDVGHNRVIGTAGTLGALLVGSWLALRWFRDRGVRRRRRSTLLADG